MNQDNFKTQTNIKTGLNKNEVQERILNKQTNKNKVKVGKSYIQIIFTDIFSFFNVLLFFIAGLMIYAEKYDGLFFLTVLLPNIAITLYEDIHARYLLGKLNLVNQPKALLLRDSKEVTVKSEDIVLNDIMILRGQNQISADAKVVSGTLYVNESMLTGESRTIEKNVGDMIYSGSFTVSGNAVTEVVAVGKNCYIETIHAQAKKFKRAHSEIKDSINRLFLGIGFVVVVIAIFMVIVYSIQGKFSTVESIKDAIGNSISGSMVAMIPSGMYLLTSAVFSLSVIKLSEKKAQIQDFYSVEMLSRVNVLCVDKTGTITDGNLIVKEILNFNKKYDQDFIKSALRALVDATEDNNVTATCIKNNFDNSLNLKAVNKLAFSSENKYSAIELENNLVFAMGAYEFLNIKKNEEVEAKINEFLSKGLRVITLVIGNENITDKKLNAKHEVIGILVLEDHIKEDAKETFKWFQDNDVEIRVISGDNAKSVAHIAKEAGIKGAEEYISLDGMSLDEVRKIAGIYKVFGRVTPEQKEVLVSSIKETGKKVAMTGDGVNDILALKRADCSIAMANGSDAARNVANIVLLDSNFHSLPNVVAEGRRIVTNLQRTCSLFLSKTMFAIFFSLAFIIASLAMNDPSVAYPFKTNHLYLWEIMGIGMSSFFLALEPNGKKSSGNFFKNILYKTLPAGIMMIVSTSAMFILYILQVNKMGYFGMIDFETSVAMAAVSFSILSLLVLYYISAPLNKYRGIVFGGACFFELLFGGIAFFITMHDGNSDKSILRIPFEKMTPMSWFVTLIVITACASLYKFANYVMKVLKEEK